MPGTARDQFRRLLTIGAIAAASAGCAGTTHHPAHGRVSHHPMQRHHPPRRARLVHFTLHSRDVGHALHEVRFVPRRHGNWTLVLLHGAYAAPSQFLHKQLFHTLSALGDRAPVVLLLDGGTDSYWHDRADGKWGSMVLHEAIPRHGRVAIGGISMGGYGALLAASREPRFCATAVMSPALWTSAGYTASGAFDSAEDYARNDVFALSPPRPLWIAIGDADPFHDAALAYAARARVTAHVSPGGHDATFWNGHLGALLRFAARACS